MAVSIKTQAYFWGGAFALLIAFLWVFKGVLTPFILGIAIAYLLEPLVHVLHKIGIKRWLASLLMLVLFFTILSLVIIFIVPPVYRELTELIRKIPDYADAVIAFASPHLEMLQAKLGLNGMDQFQGFLKNNAGKIFQAGTGVLAGLASGGQIFMSFMALVLLTPIVAFFMMREWPKATAFVEGLYPERYADTIKDLLTKIDTKIAGFVRGQLMVALVLGIVYAVVLSIAGLNYGFLIGIAAGVAGIIPLVGSTLGLIVSVVVAWLQTGGDLGFVGLIAGIFIVGQVLEGNVLTPKLIGDSVGLHPLWIIFALMAGGSLFGIAGMLLAVPITASIGVLIGYAIEQYKGSKLYSTAEVKPAPQEQR
ncbi:MAG: AI-2E family transporter [Pseudomonadota bacterium]